jgi:hypothetical protein
MRLAKALDVAPAMLFDQQEFAMLIDIVNRN